MKLRSQDRNLAKSKSNHDRDLRKYTSIETMIEHLHAEAASFGVTIVTKIKTSLRSSKVSTAYYKQIRVRHDWNDITHASQATTLAHEMVHVRQWRKYGRLGFGARYVLSQRFRWAMEMQARTEQVIAMQCLGMGTQEFVDKQAERMLDVYKLGRIRDDVRRYTPEILGQFC